MTRKGRAAIIVLLAVIAVFSLLPSLLSLPPVFSALRNQVAHQLPGRLEAASCSLGWMDGLHCTRVRYDDPERGLRVEADRVTGDKGILLLMAAPSYLGEITIERPTLTVLQPQPVERSRTDDDPVAQATASPNDKGASWWERLSLRLTLHGGRIVLDHGDQPARPLDAVIELTASLAQGAVNHAIHLASTRGPGFLHAKGFVNLPVTGQPLLETLVSQTEVDVKELEISDLLELAASRTAMPRGTGVLDATLRLKAAGFDDCEARGEIALRDLALTGGLLGDDHPRIDRIGFTFAGDHRPGQGWRLSSLDLLAEPARLSASGAFDGGTFSLTAKGRVNLPLLAAQAPRLLRLHQQTTITDGGADFSLDLSGDQQGAVLRADCRTDRLRLVHQGRPYAWDSPLTLLVEAERNGERTVFHALDVRAPFFDLKGSGDLESFTLKGTADLDFMSLELAKIFTFTERAKGRAELSVATGTDREKGGHLEGRLTIRDFSFARGEHVLMPPHDVHLGGRMETVEAGRFDRPPSAVSLDVTAWFGNIALKADDLRREGKGSRPNCTTRGTVDLERMSTLMRRSTTPASRPTLKGTVRWDGTGECEGSRIVVQNLHGTVDQPALTGAGHTLREPLIAFGLGGSGLVNRRRVAVRELTVAEQWPALPEESPPVFSLDLGRRLLEIRRFEWTSGQMVVETDWLLNDWRHPEAEQTIALRGEGDIAHLTGVAKSMGWLTPDIQTQGRARGAMTRQVRDLGERTDVTLEGESLVVLLGKKKLFTDPRPMITLTLQREGRGEMVKIPSIHLRTTPVRVEGAGLVAGTTPPSLELQGIFMPDINTLTPLLAPLTGRNVSLAGTRPAPFLLSLPLSLPPQSNQVMLSTELSADSLRLRGGLGLRQVSLPIDLNRGTLRVRIDGQLEGRQVSVEPHWDLVAERPTISLPAASQIFKDQPLRPSLTGGLLSDMHPLFHTLADSQGAIDLRADSFTLDPADKGGSLPSFTVAASLDRIRFKPKGVLREIFDLAGLDQEWFRCREKEMVCEGKNGRVGCTRIHLVAGETLIGVDGTIQPDGGLRYRVHLPVGEKLAAATQLVVQTKATVAAEIGGTRKAPVFDGQAFLSSLSGQLRREIEVREDQEAGSAASPPAISPPAEAPTPDAPPAAALPAAESLPADGRQP